MEGREGAFFCIHWSQVSADSDGPVEWCKPVPAAEAEELAAQSPELTLRVEPAHREAYVDLGPGDQIDATQWQLAEETLRSWADAQGIDDKQLSLAPFGVRITYLAGPAAEREERPGLRLRSAIRVNAPAPRVGSAAPVPGHVHR